MEHQYRQFAYTLEQSKRARNLFSAVVLAVLDDAVNEQNRSGEGTEIIARWARSHDGRTVLSCAGIDPSERVVQCMKSFVTNRRRSSVSLFRER